MNHKVLAMYLPQYYEVKENNEWWGSGYTEWIAVKNATKEVHFQEQPKIPLDNNYYDLSKVETLRWQQKLMGKYAVDGLCFYHYYFESGKLLLEKPVELLLSNKDINIPFCFCWANESWVASWSNIDGENLWSHKLESDIDGNKYLMRQEYGKEKLWEEHFNYFLPYFKDSRYITLLNKPVLLIYKADIIPCLEKMKKCWDKMARENGFDGIYLIAGNSSKEDCDYYDAFYIHEPLTSKDHCSAVKRLNEPCLIDYDDVWRTILSEPSKSKTTIFGGFVGYDDTPRHGEKGTVIFENSPEKFENYMSELIAKNIVYESPFTFVNAWNEWGEGMYLEPDTQNKYAFLEAIKNAKNSYEKNIKKYQIRKEFGLKPIEKHLHEDIEKHKAYMRILDLWLSNNEKGLKISDYLLDNSCTKICIYGYGKLGKHIISDLKETDVEVAAIIDNGFVKETDSIPVFKTGDTLPDVDLIIVAISYNAQAIVNELEFIYKNRFKVVSFDEILRLIDE